MTSEEKQLWAIEQLQKKNIALGRLPQKGDFDCDTLARIKAFLGPWPRALEKAGLKEPKPDLKKKNAHKRKNSPDKSC